MADGTLKIFKMNFVPRIGEPILLIASVPITGTREIKGEWVLLLRKSEVDLRIEVGESFYLNRSAALQANPFDIRVTTIAEHIDEVKSRCFARLDSLTLTPENPVGLDAAEWKFEDADEAFLYRVKLRGADNRVFERLRRHASIGAMKTILRTLASLPTIPRNMESPYDKPVEISPR